MTPQELKNSILQLAIQGKLVEHRPEEGTGEELYKQIQAEKAKLIKEGKIKKEKPLSPISEDEIPFEIPESWKWARLGEIGRFVRGNGIKRDETRNSGFPCIRYGQLYTTYKNSFNKAVSFVEKELYDKCQKVMNNDIVMALTGENNYDIALAVAYMGIVPVAMGGDMTKFSHSMNPMYLVYSINSSFGIKCKSKMATGQIIVHISNDKLSTIPIPLPPIAEQKRIVAKIEELLPLVEQYERAYSRLEQLNKQFPDDMKKSILQLAIQGKLVEQRPEEGTGEELYKQIQAEKARLIKEGKLKKEKPLPPISEDEIPFDIPERWKWVRLGSEIEIARGGSPRPIKEYLTQRSDGLNWIKIGDSVKGSKYINSAAEKILPSGLHKTRFVQKGDFILSNSMSFGRPYILNIDGCIHDGWLVLHQYYPIYDKDFLFYLLSSPMVFKQFCNIVAGAVVNNLNSEKVSLTIVPIPPLEEQKRIVAKIEELLPLCDLLNRKWA